MATLKLEMFEEFKIQKTKTLTGGVVGIYGTVEGSSSYQGRSYIDVRWDNGVTSCNQEFVGTTSDAGGDDMIDRRVYCLE